MSYELKVPSVPKGFPIDLDLKKALEAALAKKGVPIETAQLLYDTGMQTFVDRHAALQEQAGRDFDTLKSVLRDRFGEDGYAKKLDALNAVADELGLDDHALQVMGERLSAVNVFERMAKLGERLAAPSPRPSQANQGGDTVSKDPAQLVRELERKVDEFECDPENLRILNDPHDRMHKHIVGDRESLHKQLAAARAVANGEAPLTQTVTAEQGRQAKADRDKLEADPAWMKIFTDPAHPRNAEYAQQRQNLIALEARGAAPARGGRRAAEIQRELDGQLRDEKFMAAINKGQEGRIGQSDPEHRAALDRRDGLVRELAAAQRHEQSVATHAAATGDGQSDAA